jgi:Mrp family chromosome partitioning ATPase/uncharacterized protein involved in exopolysaccharide biosynthesis
MDQIRMVSEGLTSDEANSLHQEHSRSTIAIDGLNFIWRNIRFIVSTALACALLSYLVLSTLPRYYVATNTVVLERKDTRPFESDEQLKSQDRDRSAAETEMDFITSRQVMGRVVDKLELMKNASFSGESRAKDKQSPGFLALAGKYAASTYDYIASQINLGTSDESIEDTAEVDGQNRDRIISSLISQTSVTRGGESLAVRISVVNPNPRLAAKLANTVANEYVLASMDVKRKYSEQAAEYLKERGVQPFLTALRNEEVKLQQNRAELAAQFGANHPQIQAVDARIDTVRSIIIAEMGRITEDLNNEAERPSARIVSLAEVPTTPSYPRTNVIVSSVFLGSGILSIIGLLVVEGMRNTVRSAEQVIRMLRLPNLAYVPELRHRRFGPGLAALKETIKRPHSQYSESMRTLYLGCRMMNSVRPRQVIMVTSCMPGDGKSVISLGLAATAAADGRKTALVFMGPQDGQKPGNMDLPKPDFSPNQFFEGQCSVKSIVSSAPDLPDLNIIELEEKPFGPSSMLSSDSLSLLVQELRKEFDFIVFDTPPLLSVDDANWLAPLIDGVILTVAWGRTTENELWEAASSLRLNRSPLFGTVINRLEPRKQARFGLSGAVKYSKKATVFYRE